MTGPGERPRDPDPAALEELQRAFGGESDDDDDRSDPADPDLVTARIDAIDDGSDPEQAVVTGRVDQVGSSDGDPEAGVVTSRVGQLPVDVGTPAALDADVPVGEPNSQPDELVIVEHEPALEPPAAEPRIIRIDDYGGSVEIGAGSEPDDFGDDATPEVLGDASPSGVDAGDDAGAGAPSVISISDDEFPDAVYVEGSLDRDRDGSIVIIDDDETGDALQPDSERALRRGIEPRMRERRIAVRRAQGRHRLKILAVVVGVVVVVVLGLAALGTFFVVRAENVRVYNAVYTDEEQLEEIIDDAVGTPVLLFDTSQYEARIEEIAWVDRASVRTDFPHGLVIEIRERAAIATYQGPDERFRVIDREGRVLDVLDLYPYAYVLVGGPDTVDLDEGEFAPRGYAAAAELAKNLTATVRGNVQLIEVNAEGSRLVMYLEDGSTVFFGEARDLLAKLVRLEAVLANGQDREPGLIDISTADVTR
jgi:cell division protein FtsQ